MHTRTHTSPYTQAVHTNTFTLTHSHTSPRTQAGTRALTCTRADTHSHAHVHTMLTRTCENTYMCTGAHTSHMHSHTGTRLPMCAQCRGPFLQATSRWTGKEGQWGCIIGRKTTSLLLYWDSLQGPPASAPQLPGCCARAPPTLQGGSRSGSLWVPGPGQRGGRRAWGPP